jgi:LysR family hydrogen peroxide-inducible transcriptional activator
VVTLPLYDEPFVVLLPADHPLTAKDQITAEEMSKEQLLLLGPGHCFRDQVLESCPPLVDAITKRNDSDKPELVTEGSSLETIRHMVASGLGITVLPLSAATAIKYQEDILAVRPFAPPVPFRTVALAWRVTFPRPKAIDVLSLAASQCRVMEKAKTATPVVAERA